MPLTLLLDPHWQVLEEPIYGFFFIVGLTLIGIVTGIVSELRKNTERAFIGLVIVSAAGATAGSTTVAETLCGDNESLAGRGSQRFRPPAYAGQRRGL